MDEFEFLSLEELQIGDVLIGSNVNSNWDREYTVTLLPSVGSRIVYVRNSRGMPDSLIGARGYKFRVKHRAFKYNPDQTGDTDDDI
ncbi:hypothetical protein EVB79_032 [Rhizobium phage RHph_N3_13]|nr:hypothetical protein EVB79_032 [Rhizobium phage RHph_N3_13]